MALFILSLVLMIVSTASHALTIQSNGGWYMASTYQRPIPRSSDFQEWRQFDASWFRCAMGGLVEDPATECGSEACEAFDAHPLPAGSGAEAFFTTYSSGAVLVTTYNESWDIGQVRVCYQRTIQGIGQCSEAQVCDETDCPAECFEEVELPYGNTVCQLKFNDESCTSDRRCVPEAAYMYDSGSENTRQLKLEGNRCLAASGGDITAELCDVSSASQLWQFKEIEAPLSPPAPAYTTNPRTYVALQDKCGTSSYSTMTPNQNGVRTFTWKTHNGSSFFCWNGTTLLGSPDPDGWSAVDRNSKIPIMAWNHYARNAVFDKEWGWFYPRLLWLSGDCNFSEVSDADCPKDCVLPNDFGRCRTIDWDNQSCYSDSRCNVNLHDGSSRGILVNPLDVAADDTDNDFCKPGDCRANETWKVDSQGKQQAVTDLSMHFTIQDHDDWYFTLVNHGAFFYKKMINGSMYECNDVDLLEEPDTSIFGRFNQKPVTDHEVVWVPAVYENETPFMVVLDNSHMACIPKPCDDAAQCPNACPPECFDEVKLKTECYSNTNCVPPEALINKTSTPGRISIGGRCLSTTKEHRVELAQCDDSEQQTWTFAHWVPEASFSVLV